MKKLIIFFIVISMVTFFSMPAILFAETGDEYTALGDNGEGQYEMDIAGDHNDDPDTDVFCIDDSTNLTGSNKAYEETDEFVSDVLQNNGEGGDFGPGIGEVNAEAVEILATTATGGTPEEDQEAVWDIINNDLDSTPDENSEIIENAVMEVAADYVALPENNDGDTSNDVSLQQFLDDEKVNELEVVLDPDPLVDPATLETNTFEAEAIMENPLVPTITDEEKVVFWYIMEGSYNVSFSETDLVVTASSTMFDRLDAADADLDSAIDENTVDNDGDGDITGDNYGYSSIPYYYYWWGEGYPEYEEMNVNLFAWVDIDEDEKLDIQDIAASEPANDPDGDVVGTFMDEHQVIETQENTEYDDEQPANAYNSPHIIVDEDNNGIADTVPITETQTPVEEQVVCDKPCNFGFWVGDVNQEGQRYWVCLHNHSPHSGWKNYYCDETVMVDFELDVCEQVGGKVLEADHRDPCDKGSWTNNFRWKNGRYERKWDCYGGCHHGDHDGWYVQKYYEYQRFVIENYSEPFASASSACEAWGSFEFIKTDSVTGLPVAGATYLLTYIKGQTFDPAVTQFVLTTDADGKASVKGLPWGIYTLQETSAPTGYYVDPNVYTYHIGGEALFVEDETNVLAASEAVTNDPIPPSTGGGGGAPVITVAGLAEVVEEEEEEVGGGIQVLGIQELPFTGTSYILMLIGVAMVASAISVMIVLKRRHANK